jgi:multidrug efflux pump subunit AcrA (membrane-fusion protein)
VGIGQSAAWLVVWCGLCPGFSLPVAWGQISPIQVREAQPPAVPVADGPLQVVIEREPLSLKDPQTYHVSLSLRPAKTLELSARTDGVVNTVLVKMGDEVRGQSEAVRLESKELQLMLDRAKAAYQAAQIERKGAAAGTAQELSDARVEVAKIDLELAQYRLDQTILRLPFDGAVQRVHVVAGQYVRAGEPLLTLVDTTKLQVEIPVDRASTQVGTRVGLQVEGQGVEVEVSGLLPLTPPFEPLRDLFQSVATASAVLDNAGKTFAPGQSVYVPLIPRHPVAEVANESIRNSDDGSRRVQVIRDGFVRDVTVELLASVGEARSIISGPFGPTDELIVRSSEELLDGTQVVPRSELEQQPARGLPRAFSPSGNDE